MKIFHEGVIVKELTDFIEKAEAFKKDPRYQEMPPEIRDFFNEELGRFKYHLEILEKKRIIKRANSIDLCEDEF